MAYNNSILQTVADRLFQTPPNRPIKFWHIALGAVAITALSTISSGVTRRRIGGKAKDKARMVYKEQKQVPWAPPGWVFPAAWNINNALMTYALTRLLNHPELKHRNTLLGLQAAIWGLFVSYGYVAFRKESPVLSGVWTVADLGAAVASLVLASKSDRKLTWAYAPLALWLAFASTVAIPQALQNDDKLLGTKAFLPSKLHLN